MTDKISKERRSWNMSRIRGKNTGPEKKVRSTLFKLGIGFRIHRKDLPGNPDIVLSKYRTVIFVHGCYWHRHKGCKKTTTPKSNTSFWQAKFDETVKRDRRNILKLTELGWKVMIIWQCETENVLTLTELLSSSFKSK